jgi:5-methylcytosine-specific restriction endonuclease McrA
MKRKESEWTEIVTRYLKMAEKTGIDRRHRKFAVIRWVQERKGRGGTLTVEEWDRMLEITGGCVFCGESDLQYMTFEHLLPKSIGGGFTAENIVPACKRCNDVRGRLFSTSIDLFIAIEFKRCYNNEQSYVRRDE